MKASLLRKSVTSIINPFSLKRSGIVGNANILCMPQLSPTMNNGKISKWHVKVGQQLKEYELICDISTDSLTQEQNYENKLDVVDHMEIEVQEDSYIAHIFEFAHKEGSVLNVDTPIAILCDEKCDVEKISSIVKENNLESINNNLIVRSLFPRALWQAYSKQRSSNSNCGCM